MKPERFGFNRRVYIALNCDEQSSNFLRSWALNNGFDLTKSWSGRDIQPADFRFHTTLMYSQNTSKIPLKTGQRPIHGITMTVKDIALFGPNKNIPVLKMEPTYEVLRLRKYIEDYFGLVDSWPEYSPHLTVSYNYSGNLNDGLLQSIIDTPVTYNVLDVDFIDE